MLSTLLLLGWIVAAWSAPLEQAASPEIKPVQQVREFLILTPEAQLRLQPPYKLEQSIIQPLALYGSPGTRQSSSDICNQIFNFPTTFPFPFPGQGGSGSGDSGSTDDSSNVDERLDITQQRLPEMNNDAERIPQAMLPETPASTIPLPERRFYTIAGRPQFFGNVELLQHPLHPIFSLQPLQAIKARSVTNPEAEILQREKNTIQTIATVSEALPSPQPLRENDEKDQLQAIVSGVMYRRQIASPQVDPDIIARQFAKRITDERSSKLDQEASPVAIGQQSIVVATIPELPVAPETSNAQDIIARQFATRIQNALPIAIDQQPALPANIPVVAAKTDLAIETPITPIIQEKPAEEEPKKPEPAEPSI